ncbi:sigma-70 family RNA polymerase sigma factor [Clostridium sporogenes]|uniref:sigma-70 family RNA polymerase sigma factor n=1 Tax=Clostridium sporogenes TaxID=1509 RepID=UPI0005EDA250|nr:sigma-70 family RNA polymerase sigma factor [Clostridium sporogenes]MCW6061584.1 sigma-70 family RNA polymerase sigma factor [Clostridium sporogenes]MCW6069776.1 sigma-70 family RNA polymerase sigma factor [Clostridium sporogenes]MCW6122505.1 sigma-70 family RNA polymerase sigma factor [Clostridium sporogenes]MDS1006094.1 sigma-70 family RNA polymerase sigma factor [Clostridium sporogenes]MDU6336996.1 sigma-70 family RNA polymerase sigma factor [Clostridium sporogenes]
MINAEEHLGFVHAIAGKRYKQFKHKYTYEDLFQEGCVGLMKAINRFDNSKKIKFTTYAYHCIDGAILRMIRDDKWYGKNRKERFEKSAPYSLDAAVKGLENEIPYINLIGNDDFNFEKIEIKMLVDELPNDLKDIVNMIYVEGFTQTEIAKIVGCSQISISRLKREALDYLRFQTSSIEKKEMA